MANIELTMSIARTIISEPLRAMGVGLLRAVHCWTGRHYRRAVIRRALRRIGREIEAERRARDRAEKLNCQKLKTEIRRLGVGCRKGTKSLAV